MKAILHLQCGPLTDDWLIREVELPYLDQSAEIVLADDWFHDTILDAFTIAGPIKVNPHRQEVMMRVVLASQPLVRIFEAGGLPAEDQSEDARDRREQAFFSDNLKAMIERGWRLESGSDGLVDKQNYN